MRGSVSPHCSIACTAWAPLRLSHLPLVVGDERVGPCRQQLLDHHLGFLQVAALGHSRGCVAGQAGLGSGSEVSGSSCPGTLDSTKLELSTTNGLPQGQRDGSPSTSPLLALLCSTALYPHSPSLPYLQHCDYRPQQRGVAVHILGVQPRPSLQQRLRTR